MPGIKRLNWYNVIRCNLMNQKVTLEGLDLKSYRTNFQVIGNQWTISFKYEINKSHRGKKDRNLSI